MNYICVVILLKYDLLFNILVIMRKSQTIYLTYKECVNIVQCLNIVLHKSQHHAVLSRKLYRKLVEHDLLDDCHFNFNVSKFINSPYPYALEL